MTYHTKCIQTTAKLSASVQDWGAISNRGLSLQRNVNGNMDSTKYQINIIHDIEMKSECVVFLQKVYIVCKISHHAITLKVLNSKRTRIFIDCKEYLFWNYQGIRRT